MEELRVAAAYVGTVELSFGMTVIQTGANTVAKRGTVGIETPTSGQIGILICALENTVRFGWMMQNWCGVRNGFVTCIGPAKPTGSTGKLPLRNGTIMAVG